MYNLVYLSELGSIETESFNDLIELAETVASLGLTRTDYAITEGTLLKRALTLEDKSDDDSDEEPITREERFTEQDIKTLIR